MFQALNSDHSLFSQDLYGKRINSYDPEASRIFLWPNCQGNEKNRSYPDLSLLCTRWKKMLDKQRIDLKKNWERAEKQRGDYLSSFRAEEDYTL